MGIKVFTEKCCPHQPELPDFSELLNGNEANLIVKYHFNFTSKYFLIFYFALLVSSVFTEY